MLVRELPWQEPEAAFLRLSGDTRVVWFDAQGPAEGRARFAMIAVDPFAVLDVDASDSRDVFAMVGEVVGRYRREPVGHVIPFTGGVAGFFGYELGCRIERVARAGAGGLGLPDLQVGLFDLVVGFDRLDRRCWVFSSGLPAEGGDRVARREARAGWAIRRLEGAAVLPGSPARVRWRRETSRWQHEDRVRRTLDYILAGDIYQANITARFTADRPAGVSAAALHFALRADNAAPFGAFVDFGGGQAIASVSPERLLSVSAEGEIEARPIKGTASRGGSPGEDLRNVRALEASAKDRAENLMIVDLLRNDIGRVAEAGSIHVPEFCVVETFPHVHHLVSAVRGRLRQDADAAGLLRACFPGGSITGAPKIRAMQIISELEPVERGPYCGSIAWIGFDGAMDANVAIRTMVITPTTLAVQAGGGIVADSDPAAEFEEMMLKVEPLLRALGDVPP